MEENKNYVLEIEDLYVEYDTEDALVKAVNGFSLKLEHGHTCLLYTSNKKMEEAVICAFVHGVTFGHAGVHEC